MDGSPVLIDGIRDLAHYCGNAKFLKKIPETYGYRIFTQKVRRRGEFQFIFKDLEYFPNVEIKEENEIRLVDIVLQSITKNFSNPVISSIIKSTINKFTHNVENLNKLPNDCVFLLLSKIPYTNYAFFANMFYHKVCDF